MTKFTLTIKVNPLKVARGHQPHRGGAGKHQHRTTARQRTRSQQRTWAVKDQ